MGPLKSDAVAKREQRRYEIARDVMAAICSKEGGDTLHMQAHVEWSVAAADALLKALEA